MPVFISKTYFNEQSAAILGVFSSLEKAQTAIEEIYPTEGIEDYLVVEFQLDNPINGKENAWEYCGTWQSL